MQRLKEAKWDVTISQVKKDFEDCCRKYFSEYSNKIPPCSFFIKGDASRAGYFLCTYEGETSENHQIIINRDVVSDRGGLRSIVYHETIHFWQSIIYSRYQYKLSARNGGHDTFFHKKMEEMNQIEGAGFISVLYPKAEITTTANPFYTYVLKSSQGYYAACYTLRLDQKLIETFRRLLKTGRYSEAMWFKTNQYKYLTTKKSTGRLKLTILENEDFLKDPTLEIVEIV